MTPSGLLFYEELLRDVPEEQRETVAHLMRNQEDFLRLQLPGDNE
jgi:hypothetical protein